jgi:acetoin utilization deacetylase AcuC-like enzyme
MSLEASAGAIRSIDAWLRVFTTFEVHAPAEVLQCDPHHPDLVDAALLLKLMSLVVDKRSGMTVESLKPNGGYAFDRAGAFDAFVPAAAVAVCDVHPVAFVYDKLMLKHEAADSRIPEAPIRVERAHAALVAHSVVGPVLNAHRIPSRQASVEEIVRVHDERIYRRYFEEGAQLADAVGAPLKSDVYSCDATATAVRLACGASIDACKWVWDFDSEHALREPVAAFALIRPPGHHCSKDTPSGFCIANNAAVAAQSVRHHAANQRLAHKPRIAIVDLDVHHGEGTQALVENDPDILYISTHRYDNAAFYPFGDAGSASHVGPHHTVVNIPFDTAASNPVRCHEVMSDMALVRAWERIMQPQLEAFAPELIIVSLGFDAAYGDPLGKMAVEGGFAVIMRKLMQWCSAFSFSVNGGRVPCRGVVCLLEGGYQPSVVAARTCECFEALLRWQDRGKSSEEQQVTSHPKTWSDVRRKQERLLLEFKACVAQVANSSDAICDSSKNPPTSVHEKPSEVASNEDLWDMHVAWVEKTLNDVIDIRAQQLKR